MLPLLNEALHLQGGLDYLLLDYPSQSKLGTKLHSYNSNSCMWSNIPGALWEELWPLSNLGVVILPTSQTADRTE